MLLSARSHKFPGASTHPNPEHLSESLPILQMCAPGNPSISAHRARVAKNLLGRQGLTGAGLAEAGQLLMGF